MIQQFRTLCEDMQELIYDEVMTSKREEASVYVICMYVSMCKKKEKRYMVRMIQYSFIQMILHTRLVRIKTKKRKEKKLCFFRRNTNLFPFSNMLANFDLQFQQGFYNSGICLSLSLYHCQKSSVLISNLKRHGETRHKLLRF